MRKQPKNFVRLAICLAGGLAICAVARADDATLSGNPYESIVKRNVFGLNPVPVINPADLHPGPPPPKITLTGITTIFGEPEALFKVSGVRREGRPPEDESYIFTEGEAEDDVEVTAIDVKNSKVTFVNHGETQVIPLVAGVATTGPEPTYPGIHHEPGRFGRFPMQQTSDHFQPRYPGYNPNSPINRLSPDDRAALIAAQHAQYQQQGNPMANLFPPTQYDQQAQQAATGNNGNPRSGTPPMPVPMPGR